MKTMVPDWLLSLIQCPKTGESLELAQPDDVPDFRDLASNARLKNGLGNEVSSLPDLFLVNQSRTILYPIIDGSVWFDLDHAIERVEIA